MSFQKSKKECLNGEISFKKGLIFTIFFMSFSPIFEEGIAQLLGIGLVVKFTDIHGTFVVIGTTLCELFIICILIEKWMKIDLYSLLLKEPPTQKEVIKWVKFGILYNLIFFVKFLHSNITWETPGVFNYFFFHIILGSLLAPLIEEIIFRGFCYSAFRKKGKLLAYVGSSLFFCLSHSKSYSDLFLHGNIGIPPEKIVLSIISGLIIAYIYESTKKLTLCILYHAITNSMSTLGVMMSVVYKMMME
ncbi:MAG: CPBP family intramembrane metalloprotease [Deltaproteobacteria bacterium]|jgi:membrane protease YdiL (CAAX protease family)|nr:CPBP family intramembrane metalloprotease [Spirochaetales bacterium]MBT4286875.1 CPBP family intramembrane metalloprotease [Deltaproteobacteria bacterium]